MQTQHTFSLLVALLGGIVIYLGMPDVTGAVFVYLFGIACGGAGSRLAAIARKGI